MQGIIEGRNIHYVAHNSKHLAGMIIGVNDAAPEIAGASVDLVIFTNLDNVAGRKNFGVQFHQEVFYSETKEPGTWHFIERA